MNGKNNLTKINKLFRFRNKNCQREIVFLVADNQAL